MHFSNVLPDLDDDAATGVRGLPHRIGARGSALVAFGALLVGALAVLLGPVLDGAALQPVAVIGTITVVVIGAFGLRGVVGGGRSGGDGPEEAAAGGSGRGAGRGVFRLVMLAALVLALQLAATGLRI